MIHFTGNRPCRHFKVNNVCDSFYPLEAVQYYSVQVIWPPQLTVPPPLKTFVILAHNGIKINSRGKVNSSCLEDYKTMLHAFLKQHFYWQLQPGWDLIQNDNNIRYQKEFKEKLYSKWNACWVGFVKQDYRNFCWCSLSSVTLKWTPSEMTVKSKTFIIMIEFFFTYIAYFTTFLWFWSYMVKDYILLSSVITNFNEIPIVISQNLVKQCSPL